MSLNRLHLTFCNIKCHGNPLLPDKFATVYRLLFVYFFLIGSGFLKLNLGFF